MTVAANTRRSFVESARLDDLVSFFGPTIHAMTMLIRYSPIIGAANIVWFHASADDVSRAAAMKMIRIAYLILRQRNRAVTSRIFARKKTSVGIWKTTTMPIIMLL